MNIKITKRISAVFTALCLLCMMFAVSVTAAPEEAQKGSITVKVNASMEGLGFTLIDIGGYENDQYTPSDEFSGAGLSISPEMTSGDMKTESLKARDFAMDNGLFGITERVVGDGCAYFNDLDINRLYLIYVIDPEYSYSIQPLIIQVPYIDETAGLVYDVTAESKFVQPDSDIYTACVIVNKTDANDELLEGAVFNLFKKVYVSDPSNVKSGVQTDSDANGTFYWKQIGGDLTTNENGQIAVTELPFGTYRFIETQAPKGYVTDSTPHEFSLTKHSTIKIENDLYVADIGSPVALYIINSRDSDQSDTHGDQSVVDDSIADASGAFADESGHSVEDESVAPGEASEEEPGFQITGDDPVKYIIIGSIVGVSLVLIILLVILGGKKKKPEDDE